MVSSWTLCLVVVLTLQNVQARALNSINVITCGQEEYWNHAIKKCAKCSGVCNPPTSKDCQQFCPGWSNPSATIFDSSVFRVIVVGTFSCGIIYTYGIEDVLKTIQTLALVIIFWLQVILTTIKLLLKWPKVTSGFLFLIVWFVSLISGFYHYLKVHTPR